MKKTKAKIRSVGQNFAGKRKNNSPVTLHEKKILYSAVPLKHHLLVFNIQDLRGKNW